MTSRPAMDTWHRVGSSDYILASSTELSVSVMLLTALATNSYFNSFNATATFSQSTRMQRFLITI